MQPVKQTACLRKNGASITADEVAFAQYEMLSPENKEKVNRFVLELQKTQA